MPALKFFHLNNLFLVMGIIAISQSTSTRTLKGLYLGELYVVFCVCVNLCMYFGFNLPSLSGIVVFVG